MAQRAQEIHRTVQRADLDGLAADMDMDGFGSEFGYRKRHDADPPKKTRLLIDGRLAGAAAAPGLCGKFSADLHHWRDTIR
ncbi:hypothetical protein GCM10028812_09250 [Ancylobacter sonchi]